MWEPKVSLGMTLDPIKKTLVDIEIGRAPIFSISHRIFFRDPSEKPKAHLAEV